MRDAIYLVKVGELTLKGGNIKDFEQRLVQNAKLYLEGTNSKVRLRAGRMYIEGPESAVPAIEYALHHLIGISGWARALITEKNIEAITSAVYSEAIRLRDAGMKTFKIEARRAEKSFPLTSYEIACQAGEAVHEAEILKVNVKTPDVVINVEVRERCFVYGTSITGCRGLPCGTGGRALLLLSGGIDSPVAGYRMLYRGMKLDCLYFHSHPYTSPQAREKVETLAGILARYGVGVHFNCVPFTAVQQRIRDRGPAAYSTLLLRMCMMKTANLQCDFSGAKAIITGESLGQVASQTIENLNVTNTLANRPVLRPLIGMDKQEIIDLAIKIGTYETSILPYDDCCVLFSPKHPVLKANLEETLALYEELEIDELIQEAFDSREHMRFGCLQK
ncbi:MAG TPA: tRNA 4-thiouridine(8) synthase ThiI [Treponema sp.]|nr:tRNA 4-thiouridine(8) synthase ThiI [Treponema sp.]